MRRRSHARSRRAVRALGPVHVLVNNAGHATASMFQDTTLEPVAAGDRRQSDRHVPLHPARAAAPCWLPATVASSTSRRRRGCRATRASPPTAPRSTVSSASRARWRPRRPVTGVTVNAVCPGYIEGTSMLRVGHRERGPRDRQVGRRSARDSREAVAGRQVRHRWKTWQPKCCGCVRPMLPRRPGRPSRVGSEEASS